MSDTHEIRRKAMSGETLDDVFIFDCHGHLDYWKNAFKVGVDAESIIADMDRIGIDKLCVNKWNCPDIINANDAVAAAVKTYPDRLVGFVNTSPSWGRKAMEDELKRCFDTLGFKGIKVHNGYETLPPRKQADSPEFMDALAAIREFANERKCPMLCHGFLTPEVAKNYPDAKFIAAHACGSPSVVHAFNPFPNVYFDTANSLTISGNMEYYLKHTDIERILFGTDMPYANPAYRLGQVIGSSLNDEQLTKILGLNMKRMMA